MNNCTFLGNLGGNAEFKTVGEKNTPLLSFSLAVNSRRKDAAPMWIRCNLWGKQAEGKLREYLNKGTQVVVTGELQTREYEKADGMPGFSTELNVNRLDLCGGRREAGETEDDDAPPLD